MAVKPEIKLESTVDEHNKASPADTKQALHELNRRGTSWHDKGVPTMVPRKRSKDTLATFPMTGDVTTATVIAAHFQLCNHAFATGGGSSAMCKPYAP